MESQAVHIHHSPGSKSQVHFLIIPAVVFVVTLYFLLSLLSMFKPQEISQIEDKGSAVLGEQDQNLK